MSSVSLSVSVPNTKLGVHRTTKKRASGLVEEGRMLANSFHVFNRFGHFPILVFFITMLDGLTDDGKHWRVPAIRTA